MPTSPARATVDAGVHGSSPSSPLAAWPCGHGLAWYDAANGLVRRPWRVRSARHTLPFPQASRTTTAPGDARRPSRRGEQRFPPPRLRRSHPRPVTFINLAPQCALHGFRRAMDPSTTVSELVGLRTGLRGDPPHGVSPSSSTGSASAAQPGGDGCPSQPRLSEVGVEAGRVSTAPISVESMPPPHDRA